MHDNDKKNIAIKVMIVIIMMMMIMINILILFVFRRQRIFKSLDMDEGCELKGTLKSLGITFARQK